MNTKEFVELVTEDTSVCNNQEQGVIKPRWADGQKYTQHVASWRNLVSLALRLTLDGWTLSHTWRSDGHGWAHRCPTWWNTNGTWTFITPARETDALLCSHQISPGHNALGMAPLQLATKGHSIPNSQTTWLLKTLYIPERIGSRWAGVWWGVENLIVYMKS